MSLRPILLLLVSCCYLSSAWADWVIIQKTDVDGKMQEMTMQVKEHQARIDVGAEMSLISDTTTGDIQMFMHPQKMMMKLNGDSMKSMMVLAGAALGGNETPAKPVASGKVEKVGDHDAEIFTWSGKLGNGRFWVAKDFPDFKALNEVQDKMLKAMGNPVSSLAPASSDFPGMVVKSEIEMMGKKTLSELVSAKQATVDAAIFKAPEGYQEMKMPSLPGK